MSVRLEKYNKCEHKLHLFLFIEDHMTEARFRVRQVHYPSTRTESISNYTRHVKKTKLFIVDKLMAPTQASDELE